MPLNDEQAINELLELYDSLENRARLEEGQEPNKEELRRYKAEQTVAIFKRYILTGDVETLVTGTDSQGGTIAGQGKGKIVS